MPNAFERHAIQLIVDKATAAGVEVPRAVSDMLCKGNGGSYAARAWAEAHPDEDWVPCCYGSDNDPADCTCWRPVFEIDQRPPRPPARPRDLAVQRRMCGDCAFRKGSPERADAWSEDALFDLARGGTPFWCHEGMRRPVRWEHPDGRIVPGSPDDWQPPMLNGIPYQADGAPGLLCAGWMARGVRAHEEADNG